MDMTVTASVALAIRWYEFKLVLKAGVENNKIKILEVMRITFGLVGKLAAGSCVRLL